MLCMTEGDVLYGRCACGHSVSEQEEIYQRACLGRCWRGWDPRWPPEQQRWLPGLEWYQGRKKHSAKTLLWQERWNCGFRWDNGLAKVQPHCALGIMLKLQCGPQGLCHWLQPLPRITHWPCVLAPPCTWVCAKRSDCSGSITTSQEPSWAQPLV
jgi:hypothetical protein